MSKREIPLCPTSQFRIRIDSKKKNKMKKITNFQIEIKKITRAYLHVRVKALLESQTVFIKKKEITIEEMEKIFLPPTPISIKDGKWSYSVLHGPVLDQS